MGGTIQTQSAGHPPRTIISDFMCVMKLSVVEWWSATEMFEDCMRDGVGERRENKVYYSGQLLV